MDTPQLESMYRRWLDEVWGHGRTDVARELMAEDLIDHNPYPGQPAGLEGHDWAVAMVRGRFPTWPSPPMWWSRTGSSWRAAGP